MFFFSFVCIDKAALCVLDLLSLPLYHSILNFPTFPATSVSSSASIQTTAPVTISAFYLYASGVGRHCILGWSSVKLDFFFVVVFFWFKNKKA